ncbi:MAG: hypothetical protein AAGK74_14605 [Chloroflexota bacterium]
MTVVGYILLVIGLLLALYGGISLLIIAFRKSILWGLGCLFVPFVSLVFAIMNWDEAGRPFLISVGGSILYGSGASLAGRTVASGVPAGMILFF